MSSQQSASSGGSSGGQLPSFLTRSASSSASMAKPLADLFSSLYFLSFYAPQIIVMGMLLYSMFSVTLDKFGVYMLFLFVITFLRVLVIKVTGGTSSNQSQPAVLPAICKTGLTQLFVSNDVTYSTYVICFTLFYLIMPMIMVSYQSNSNAINYYILSFLVAYIVFDLLIKRTLYCVPALFSVQVISDVLAGAGLGAIIAGPVLFGSAWQSHLYINELTGDGGEVCSMPTKQQFKCSVYKNGQLVQ